MMEKNAQALRSQAKILTPVLQIGKNGLTQGSIDLIDRELDTKHLIKVKLLSAALPDDANKSDRRALASEMASRTRSRVIEQVGNIVVLYRAH